MPAYASTGTWLDGMDEISLARGVPVVLPEYPKSRGVCTGIVDAEWPVIKWDHEPNTTDLIQHGRCVAHWLRPDLDDAQGFAYVLRWYTQRSPVQHAFDFEAVLLRHMLDDTTDADRRALARACREASP